MLTRNTSSGASLNYYDRAEIQRDRQAAVINGIPMNRRIRRKQERKLNKLAKKHGGYIERSDY